MKQRKLDLGVRCETCGTREGLTASHFVKENHVHKKHRIKYDLEYDYNSTDNYFTQCLDCHKVYELLGTKKKFPNQETRQDYMRERGFESYARRIEYWINP